MLELRSNKLIGVDYLYFSHIGGLGQVLEPLVQSSSFGWSGAQNPTHHFGGEGNEATELRSIVAKWRLKIFDFHRPLAAKAALLYRVKILVHIL